MASSRRRPLHTCAVSFLAITLKASLKAQELDGPIGTMVKRSAIFVSPIFSAAQCLLLSTLAFVDRCILACQDIIASLFPPSNCMFNKIDELVRATETLPGKFDSFLNELPSFISQIPFLDWALVRVIAWLNFLLSRFVACGTKEIGQKDTAIHKNYTKRNEESTVEHTTRLGDEDAKESSYETDSTVQTVGTEESDKEEAMVESTVEPTTQLGNENEQVVAKESQTVGTEESDKEAMVESTVDPTTQLGNENEQVPKESSYETDSTVQTVGTEESDREEEPVSAIGSSKEILEKGNVTQTNKKGLAEEWFEAGWAIKPKQAPKRKQKGKKKKN